MEAYEVVVQGHIDKRRFRGIAEMELVTLPTGETKIICYHLDQAALHAVLIKIYDLGLQLRSLKQMVVDIHEKAEIEGESQ